MSGDLLINSGKKTIFSEILCLGEDFVITEISTDGIRHYLRLLKDGKKMNPIKISLYINDAIIETFILKNGECSEYVPRETGQYSLRIQNQKEYIQFNIEHESKNFYKRRSKHLSN